jgi:hypothetical protein
MHIHLIKIMCREQDFLIFYYIYLQWKPVEGVIFSDYGTDLGSGLTVPGRSLFDLFNYYFWATINFICLIPSFED